MKTARILGAVRFLGLLAMGAELGVSYSHELQKPGKRQLPPDAFLWVQNVLIRKYALGVGVIESGAMLSTLMAAVISWRMPGERWSVVASNLVAFSCLAAMFVVFARRIEPINQEVRGWEPETVPEEWTVIRDRWHSLHSVRFALATVGMVALVGGALAGTSGDPARRPGRSKRR